MQTLTIEAVTTAKSGKSLRVKAGDKWYGAKKDSGLSKGMVIEAETSNGEYGDWIDKWKLINGSAAQPGTASGSAGADSSVGLKPNAPAGAAPAWLPFCSNVTAHAIQAGLITEPGQVKLWAAAAKQAFTELA